MKVHHIALRTRDLDGLTAFYLEVVGLKVTKRDDGRSVWLSAGETVVMLERAGEGEFVTRDHATTMDLVAFAIDGAEFVAFRARLAKANVVVEGETAFTLYFRDPDGRRVGVSHYAFV